MSDLLSGLNPALEKAELKHKEQIGLRDARILELENALNLFVNYHEWDGDDIGDHSIAYSIAVEGIYKALNSEEKG